jgi:aspartate beta-hydroxylase
MNVPESTHKSSLYDGLANALRAWFDRRISGNAILESARLFPDAQLFQANWQAIRDEAFRVTRHIEHIPRFHELMASQASISANDARDWRMFIMRAYGVTIDPNLAQCPTVASALAQAPDVLSASFSILGPGKHVPEHRGPFRGILRGYLVLVMPRGGDGKPAAVLKIDRREYRLEEGQFLLWDDTFEHAVWNESDENRVVLLLDIKRRDMPFDMRFVSGVIVRAVRLWILLSRSRRIWSRPLPSRDVVDDRLSRG